MALLFVHALTALAEQQSTDAEQALIEATTIQEEMPHTMFIGSARLWRVCLYEQTGRSDAARDLLLALLTECQQAGTPGLILREGALFAPVIERLPPHWRNSGMVSALVETLREGGKPRPIAVPGTGETLTAREVEVLRLLASGASNQEIAAQLVITVSTAKAHVSSIIAKLRVASRSAAVARGRALQLL